MIPQYQGSIVNLVTGDRVLVLEDYEVVNARLWPPSSSPVGISSLHGSTQSIRQGSVSGLEQALGEKADLPVTEGTPEQKTIDAEPPAKKPPVKRVEPKVEDKSEEEDVD